MQNKKDTLDSWKIKAAEADCKLKIAELIGSKNAYFYFWNDELFLVILCSYFLFINNETVFNEATLCINEEKDAETK